MGKEQKQTVKMSDHGPAKARSGGCKGMQALSISRSLLSIAESRSPMKQCEWDAEGRLLFWACSDSRIWYAVNNYRFLFFKCYFSKARVSPREEEH